jgi:eukaryotic-like serine/threonine-protein kinase
VALKQILDTHADDPASRQRFLLEAEVTGGLEHPGIVPVYCLGTYGDGRPYYAMRFIRGDSLKEAIEHYHASAALQTDPGRRSLEQHKLLRRFIDVCNAIDYAHSRGVLHRDIKPGNVLVGKHGETLIVDWGLAKPTGQSDARSDERTLRPSSASGSAETLPGSALGTPAYMSPEQAEGDLDRLGTRSDVYSLGATLYCLLTGRPPFEGGDIGGILRGVQRGDFRPPRTIDPATDRALEAVCLKAMALKPEDRYGSCRALAEDVERWMADEPVSAWREPFFRRVRRWARRNRTAVAAALVALAVGVIGLGAVAGVQARANHALRKANDATKQALGQAKEAQRATDAALAQSEESRRQAEAVSLFLVDAFRSPDPEHTGREVKVADVLDRASAQLDKEFAGSRATKGALLEALGLTYGGLGLFDEAVSLHTRERAEREAALGSDHPSTLNSRDSLATVYVRSDRLSEAIPLYEETLRLREARLGLDHPDTLKSRNFLAHAYHDAGRMTESIALLQATLKLFEAKLGPDHPDVFRSRGLLASAYSADGRTTEALALFESALKLFDARLGPDHSETLIVRNNQAVAYKRAGRLPEAIALLEPALKLHEAKLGSDHAATLQCRNNLTTFYLAAGRLADVIALNEKEFRRVQLPFGPGDSRTLQRAANLAMAYKAVARAQRDAGRHQEALDPYRRAVTIQEDLVKRRPEMAVHKNILAWFLTDFGMCLREMDSLSEAEPALERALAIWLGRISEQSSVGPGSTGNLLWTLDELGKVDRKSGRVGQAIAAYRRAMEVAARLVAAHPEVPHHAELQANLHEGLAQLLAESGRSAEAMTLRRQAVAIREQSLERCASKLGPDHPDTLKSRTGLINAYESLGRWADAEPRRRDALAVRRQTAKPDSPLLADELADLGHNLLTQNKASEAEPLLRECMAIRGQAAPDDLAHYDAMSLLGGALLGQGRYFEAEPLIVPGYEGMKERQAKIAGLDRSRLREAAERVVRMYEEWGKAEQATLWKAKLRMPDLPANVFARP